jgi:hypothetical protein
VTAPHDGARGDARKAHDEVPDIDTALLAGRTRCCDQDHGGSHYHCGRCNGVTGMYGHHRGGEYRDGKWRRIEPHFCCPNNCENPEAHRG